MSASGSPPDRHAVAVLLAEDEPMLRRVVHETLRRDGFDVIDAADGSAGLEVLRSDTPIDVLLSDVKMPGLNGYQLAEAALELRPDIKVMLMTGYADEVVPDALQEASVPILRKPFDFATLGPSLRKMVTKY